MNLKGSAHSAVPREKARTMWKCFLGSERVRFAAEVHGHESALDTPLGLVRHPPGIFQRPPGDHDSVQISTFHLLRETAATENTIRRNRATLHVHLPPSVACETHPWCF